jgi:LacI family transcriptional regulator
MSEGPSGEAATIYDVARRAGVSTATVSRVLRGTTSSSADTHARVLAAARDLSYRPMRRPRLVTDHRREAFGMVLPDLDGPHYSELVLGLESAAAELGQYVMLLVTRRRTDVVQAVRDLAARVDGLAVAQGTVPDSVVQSLSRTRPVVLMSRTQVPGCDAVVAENAVSAARLTTHLIEHGRRHLVFVGDPDTAPDVAERYSGFRHAHAAAGLPVRRPPLRVPLVEGAGIQVAEEILRRRVKVDGLVCANDELALAVMKRLWENGVLVPDDLAIVGWDDVVTARYVVPGLTTVRAPTRELGRIAVTRLAARVGGEAVINEAHQLPSSLVLRSSCGCPTSARQPATARQGWVRPGDVRAGDERGARARGR